MNKLLLSILLYSSATVAAQPVVITNLIDPGMEIDLYHPESGDWLLSIPPEQFPLPLNIKKDNGNGSFIIQIKNSPFMVESSNFRTTKSYKLKMELEDCKNQLPQDKHAATRGLGLGCNNTASNNQ